VALVEGTARPLSFARNAFFVVAGVLLTGRGVAIGWGLRDADPT
jgi:hypothetical protein